MRNISSAVMSLGAMVLSTLTTYLTFFDSRYTLTAALADTPLQMSRGSGYNGEVRSVNYRFYTEPTLILSNRGTRAVVVADLAMVESTKMKSCNVEDDAERHRAQFMIDSTYNWMSPVIVEPGAVSSMEFLTNLDTIIAEAQGEDKVVVEGSEKLWCLEWTVFDPNGKRHVSLMPALIFDLAFEYEEGEKIPEAKVEAEPILGPNQLISRGLF